VEQQNVKSLFTLAHPGKRYALYSVVIGPQKEFMEVLRLLQDLVAKFSDLPYFLSRIAKSIVQGNAGHCNNA